MTINIINRQKYQRLTLVNGPPVFTVQFTIHAETAVHPLKLLTTLL